jgi:tRNA dimethylallyltransferase
MKRKVESANLRYSGPVIVVVGATASGKTGLAIELAKKYKGEIISADSRAIYKYADIGTAKPTTEEQQGVPHWGIDLIGPGEKFTVYDFQQYALGKIEDIRNRGKVPFLVGGSGLYVDSVIYGYNFDSCKKSNASDRLQLEPDVVIVGIDIDKALLKERIKQRAEEFFKSDIIGETKLILGKYGANSQLAKSNIYPIISQYLDGDIDLAQAKDLFVQSDIKLVKKQATWFKRNKQIVWLTPEQIGPYVDSVLKQ